MPTATTISETFSKKELVQHGGEWCVQESKITREYLPVLTENYNSVGVSCSGISEQSPDDGSKDNLVKKERRLSKQTPMRYPESNKPSRSTPMKALSAVKNTPTAVKSIQSKVKNSPPVRKTPQPAGAHIHDVLNVNNISVDLSLPYRHEEYQKDPDEAPIRIPYNILDQSATREGLTSILIECDLIPKWPIEIKSLSPVTVREVLEEVYKCAHQPVSEAELRGLGEDERRQVRNAAWERCRTSRKTSSVSVERVDFLGEKKYFRGLALDSLGPDRLKMFVTAV
ncbi:hypothetical protein BDQ17DRAFT_1346261 [Cyathus striatus]|nr:hypothetical protein BDQ17DRAFT_1346261 [Cyathus striatus]